MKAHTELIQLVVAWTLTGALVFTVVITCLSLVGWIKFADQNQQNKLFTVLIVELVVVAVTFFGGLLKYNPNEVEQKIRAVEQYKVLSTGFSRFTFAAEILEEYLQKGWTTKPSMVQAVTEYNEAITSLRVNEPSSRQLIGLLPDGSKASSFDDAMKLVLQIDEVIHGLNGELEKVSILGTQEKVTPGVATASAAKLKPLIADLKTKSANFVPPIN